MVIWAEYLVSYIKKQRAEGEFLDLKSVLHKLVVFYDKPETGSKAEDMEADYLLDEFNTVLKKHKKTHSLEKIQSVQAAMPKGFVLGNQVQCLTNTQIKKSFLFQSQPQTEGRLLR